MPPLRYSSKLPAPLEQIALVRREERVSRSRKLKITSYSAPSKRGLQLTAPGSVTFFLARKGAPILDAIRKAAAVGKVDRRLLSRIYEPMSKLRPKSLDARRAAIRRQPVLAEIRYGGRALAEHLFANGDQATIVVCPYNGGRFAPDGFSLVEHVADGAQIDLDVVVVARVPPLSKIEQAAIDKVPVNERGINVGPGIHAGFPEFIAFFLLGVVVGAGVWAAVDHVMDYVHAHNHEVAADAGQANFEQADGGHAEAAEADAGQADAGQADAGQAEGGQADAQQQDAGQDDHAQDFGDAGDAGDAGEGEGEADHAAEGERFGLGRELFEMAGLTAEEISRRGPAASAAKLVALRRIALLRN